MPRQDARTSLRVSLVCYGFAPALIGACVIRTAVAADALPTITDPEKSYLAIRNSKDRKTQLIAERWYGLVRLQDWADASGKFKSTAKYVEQDEAQGSVKLRVFKGTGKDQVISDRTVPIDKLSKECQSRVKQIAFLAEKVDEAAKTEAGKTTKPKEGDAAAPPGMAGPPDGRDGRVAGMTPLDAAAAPGERGARPPRGKAGAKDRAKGTAGSEEKPKEDAAGDLQAQQTPPAADASTPLPAALPSVPGAATAAADPRTSPAPDAASQPPMRDPRAASRPVEPANMPDEKPWRTSFDAFRAQFKAERTDSGWNLGWGELEPLHQAHDHAVPPEPGRRMPPGPTLESLGEFTWVVPLSVQPDDQTDWSKALGLALPEPFKIIATLDGERGPGDWHRFFPNDPVKFIGRFAGFEGDGGISIAIRFPDSELAPVPHRAGPPQ